jgi:hypothetical protein
MVASFNFSPSKPRLWAGRYGRIPGERTAFHVRLIDGKWWPSVDWAVDDEVAHCPMVECDGAAELAAAVNAGKRLVGGSLGGAFLVNEYAQVLVPAATGDHRVAVVGECDGPFEFWDMFDGDTTFDLSDDDGLELGDSWELPYLGVPHNLSARGEIYFKLLDESGITPLPAPSQDDELIDALRTLRPYGPVRFVVAYGGLVLTKVPVGRGSSQRWEPRYVGRLDYERWYPKEI